MEEEKAFVIPRTLVFAVLGVLLNIVYLGMPLWLYNDVVAQVKEKVSKEAVELRLKRLEKDVDTMTKKVEQMEKVTTKLDFYLDQQAVMKNYDSTKKKK